MSNPAWGASWTRHEFPGDTGVAYIGSHVSLFYQFLYNNIPVVVENPQFTLKLGNNPVSIRILRPLSQIDIDETRYLVTFIADGLQANQEYEAEAIGIYNGQPLVITGKLKFIETDRIQFFIDTLRTHLSDINTLYVPKKYILHDPRVHEWEDGELYVYLQRAVEDINLVPPVTIGMWNLDNVPFSNFVIMGAMFYALLQHQIMEVHNYFDYATDVKVSFYRGDKYSGIYQFIRKEYFEPLKTFKKDYMWRNLRPKVIVLTKYPFRVLRPISMNLFFQSILP